MASRFQHGTCPRIVVAVGLKTSTAGRPPFIGGRGATIVALAAARAWGSEQPRSGPRTKRVSDSVSRSSPRPARTERCRWHEPAGAGWTLLSSPCCSTPPREWQGARRGRVARAAVAVAVRLLPGPPCGLRVLRLRGGGQAQDGRHDGGAPCGRAHRCTAARRGLAWPAACLWRGRAQRSQLTFPSAAARQGRRSSRGRSDPLVLGHGDPTGRWRSAASGRVSPRRIAISDAAASRAARSGPSIRTPADPMPRPGQRQSTGCSLRRIQGCDLRGVP